MTQDKDALGIAQHDGDRCLYCGLTHPHACPRVARVEYNADGYVVAVELHGPQSFTVERSAEECNEMVSGSYEDVRRYQRERKMQ